MLNKTTNISFRKYGEVYTDYPSTGNRNNNNNDIIKFSNNSCDILYYANQDIYIKELEGLALLICTNNLSEKLETFIIHRVIKLNKGTYFNFIALSNNAKLEISSSININNNSYKLNQPYIYNKIKSSIIINEIIAYYYSVRNMNYFFPAEKHNYWELIFVDNGIFKTSINDEIFELNTYEAILFSPGEFHLQATGENKNCSYMNIIFDMEISNNINISNRVFKVDRETHATIEKFITTSNLNDEINNNLLVTYLQEIINRLIFSKELNSKPIQNTPLQQNFENELLNEIIIYINENIYSPLTVEELSQKFLISRSSLQNIFKNNLNVSPKKFINNVKLEKAKILIKENKYTISEISNMLGFGSIHYFSRKFKEEFNISPSEFAKKIYS